jgi:hypothetical protein
MHSRFATLSLAAVIASISASPASAQTRPEVIRGRVTTDSGAAIAGADIIVTMAPNREIFRAASDAGGAYRVSIANGTGDYLVYIAAPGRRALRKRVTRTGDAAEYVVNAQLPKEVAVVAAVRTTARRTPPSRDDDAPETVGGLTAQYGSVAGALSPDQMGDLAAMATTVPGVATTPDGGVSALGVDPSQNRTTLDGLSFDAASLPRELPLRTRVSSSIYDPTVGGFGGLLISAEISPGAPLPLARGSVTLDAPPLQATDAAARALGQRYTAVSASYMRGGEVQQDRWVYRGAVQGGRRDAPLASIVSPDAATLDQLGVAGDSVNAFLQSLGALGVPVVANGIGSRRTATDVSGAIRFDRAGTFSPFGIRPDTKPRLALVGIGSYHRTDPTAMSPFAPPAHGARNASGNASLQLIGSRYFGAGDEYLSETRTAVSYSAIHSDPYLALPSGSVRVMSALADGSLSNAALQFGGGAAQSDLQTWRWEASSDLTFSPTAAPTHRIKMYGQAQVDGFRQSALTNALGSFAYASLADLAANAPASYSRTLFTPMRTGGEASGALAIADYWTKSPELQFIFGPRVEWNAFTRAPAANPEVARVFGARTDVAPADVHVSPRFGFSWLYPGVRKAGRGGASVSGIGSQFTPPRGVLRGGIGEFRSLLAPSLLGDALVSTGLPGTTTQRITCLGSAVPAADWRAFAADPNAVPNTCDGGPSTFSDAAPSVVIFDPSYSAARRWTANLGWGSAYKFWYYTLDATYSLNLDQPGTVDLNFDGTPRFTLANEAQRPVYVDPTSIVPSSGLVSPVDARLSDAFGRVISRRSDGRSHVAQGTVTLLPYLPQRLAQFMARASYTISQSRTFSRGFDGTAFGDPRLGEWAAGFVPTHQFRLQLGYRLPKLSSTFTTFWNVQSGYPYTPVVGGDINGDGLTNDRAFVFDPARAPTPAMSAALSNLLMSTNGSARDCLTSQLGAVAARNSCLRPWTATMNARWDFNKRFGDNFHYVTGAINFANPLAGVDHLLHGANHLRGWGVPAVPDPTLYVVRGFDATTRQFAYDVNPNFGATRPALAALYAPFRVTLEVSFSLSGDVGRHTLELYLRPTRSAPGERPPADTILARIESSGASPLTPYGWLLANSDSLLLSAAQVRAIQSSDARFRAAVDSVRTALARELAALPADYDAAAVTKHMLTMNRMISDFPKREGPALREILTPIQLRLMPFIFQQMLAPPPAPRPASPPPA